MVYSVDLRKRAVEAVQQGMTLIQAEKTFKVTRKAIGKWIKRLEKNGDLNPEIGYQKGHSHKITDWVLFEKFANENKHLTVAEMTPKWKNLTNTDLSKSTVLAGLKKNWIYFQKKTFSYIEADKEKQKIFQEELSKIAPGNIVYSDETGIDDNEVRKTGWSKKGKRCYAQKKAERTTRYNIAAAYNQNKLFAPFLFEGYSNSMSYKTYIKEVLAPALRPGMVLVIDNASFHKSKDIIEIIESVGCKVLFLPPYSPEFNPIEHVWACVKNTVRKTAEFVVDFYDAAVQALEELCAS